MKHSSPNWNSYVNRCDSPTQTNVSHFQTKHISHMNEQLLIPREVATMAFDSSIVLLHVASNCFSSKSVCMVPLTPPRQPVVKKTMPGQLLWYL